MPTKEDSPLGEFNYQILVDIRRELEEATTKQAGLEQEGAAGIEAEEEFAHTIDTIRGDDYHSIEYPPGILRTHRRFLPDIYQGYATARAIVLGQFKDERLDTELINRVMAGGADFGILTLLDELTASPSSIEMHARVSRLHIIASRLRDELSNAQVPLHAHDLIEDVSHWYMDHERRIPGLDSEVQETIRHYRIVADIIDELIERIGDIPFALRDLARVKGIQLPKIPS